MGGLNPYRIGFDPRAVSDGAKLLPFLRRRILDKLEFLRAAPFRSHPGVLVKELAELRGVWRFHVTSNVRVFYTVAGDTIWVLMIERSAGVTKETVRELVRRL
ncbi:MAG: type II toxin-antitoxin system RelE/ParE family toxin [Thermoplasmata archaeon]